MNESRNSQLRKLLRKEQFLLVPGVYDALSAKIAEAESYQLLYVGSYATAASRFGVPDVGVVSVSEMADHAGNVARAVNVPVIADAENGFNNAANIWRTVALFEQNDVSGIHIEDHEFGKHLSTPQVFIESEKMVAKIQAALDARKDPDFVIIARTDVMLDMDKKAEAVKRANAYAEAGADMVFLAGCKPPDLKAMRGDISTSVVLVNTDGYTSNDEKEAGANLVIYYAIALYAAYSAVRSSLRAWHDNPAAKGGIPLMDDPREFEEFIGFGEFTKRAHRYKMF